MSKNTYYNPQTNIFDALKKKVRSSDWYDHIWKEVGKCVFCDLKERYIIFEKNGIVLTANLYPYTDAHLLIVPRRHIEYAKEFTPEEWESVRATMYVAKKLLRKVFNVKNIWYLYREGPLGQAQKTVGHLHIQIIPYKDGLFKVNYQPISWAPGETGDRLKIEKDFMEKRYKKYIEKYGKLHQIEKRIVVTALIKNNKGEILLVQKKNKKEWETPGGSVEGNESLEEALKREIKEETGIAIKNTKLLTVYESEQEVIFKEGFKRMWKLIFICYLGEFKSGKLKALDDIDKARWISIKELKKYKLTKITSSMIKAYFKD
jgi:mutator protein MutT